MSQISFASRYSDESDLVWVKFELSRQVSSAIQISFASSSSYPASFLGDSNLDCFELEFLRRVCFDFQFSWQVSSSSSKTKVRVFGILNGVCVYVYIYIEFFL